MQPARATPARTLDPAARQRRDQGDLDLVLRARNGNDAVTSDRSGPGSVASGRVIVPAASTLPV